MSYHVSLLLYGWFIHNDTDISLALTSLLSENLSQHRSLLALKNSKIDELNTRIRDLSSQQESELERLQSLKRKAEQRSERLKRIDNLQRTVDESRASQQGNSFEASNLGSADQVDFASLIGNSAFDPSHLPDLGALKQHVRAYATNNRTLSQRAQALQSRSATLEAQYRRVVALCTGVEEGRVDSVLPSLVAAVESERGSNGLLSNTHESRAADQSMSGSQTMPTHFHAPGHTTQQPSYQQNMSNGSFGTNAGAGAGAAAMGSLSAAGGPSIDIGRVRSFLAMVEGVQVDDANGAAAAAAPGITHGATMGEIRVV